MQKAGRELSRPAKKEVFFVVNKVMVAMSGGVDSSVAALLLKDRGYDVCGATLRLFSNEDIGLDKTHSCCSIADVEDARSVARRLGFEHFVFNFGSLFGEKVVSRFAEQYLIGNTPNPCIDCNRFIKFDKLLDRAELLDMDYIATGHYARVEKDEKSGRFLLKKGMDKSKDQSYVLYAMTQKQLKKTIFPLGDLNKAEVRAIAEEKGLINAAKPDSQDICFVKDGDYAAFLENIYGATSKPGDFVDSKGKILGRHRGLIRYTIGQRKGLGLSFDNPKYVIGKDIKSNTVILGNERELYSNEMSVGDLNLISLENIKKPLESSVKTRYSQIEARAIVYPPEDGRALVRFETPQRAITPGQAAVFYDGDIVIGGGTII